MIFVVSSVCKLLENGMCTGHRKFMSFLHSTYTPVYLGFMIQAVKASSDQDDIRRIERKMKERSEFHGTTVAPGGAWSSLIPLNKDLISGKGVVFGVRLIRQT